MFPALGPAIGVDVGGTKIAAGLVGGDGQVLDELRTETPADDPAALLDAIVTSVTELRTRSAVARLPIGVSAAGLVDREGVVRYAPNIAWRDEPLLAKLGARLAGEGPIVVENDASAAVWGEYRVGAGRAARTSLIMLTVGTGVGGGLVLEDRLMRGAHGLGAEFGHIVLQEGGPACKCGNRGDLEALASGTAIGRMAREALAAGEVAQDSPLARAQEVTGETVTEAAMAGDAVALRVLDRAGFWLGVGIGSLINALDPELVVVGGGAMAAGELLLVPARAAAEERILGRGHRPNPPIVKAGLGGRSGMVGAALLAQEGAFPTEGTSLTLP